MKRVIRAELLRLVRRRTVVIAMVAAMVFSWVATLAVFASAGTTGATTRGSTTLSALAGDGGGTEAFAIGASFAGFLVFVTFIALIAGDLSGGTFRALLPRQPHRVRLIAGKLVGIVIVAATVVAVAEAATLAVSLVVAATKDVPTRRGSRPPVWLRACATTPACSAAWRGGPSSEPPWR